MLNYKDMEGMIKPTLHVDEFASKMGDDEDIIVVSFFVRSEAAARDLVAWFEKGYDWVLDSEHSPGEIRPNRYLVYVEMRRRNQVAAKIKDMLEDLETLTELSVDQWRFHYRDAYHDFSEDEFRRVVPLTPREYRRSREEDLNEVRAQAGIPHHDIHDRTPQTLTLQSAAGII